MRLAKPLRRNVLLRVTISIVIAIAALLLALITARVVIARQSMFEIRPTIACNKAMKGRGEEFEPARPGRWDDHAFHVVFASVVSI